MDTTKKDSLLTGREVQAQTSLSRSSLHDLMKHPDPETRFPRGIKIGPRRVRWSALAVGDWIERQKQRAA